MSNVILPYIRVNQKNTSFFISRASALDLRQIVDFHFREPYKDYVRYVQKDFEDIKRELTSSGAVIQDSQPGNGVQRALNKIRVHEIRDYIRDDPESLLPSTVLLAIDTSECEDCDDGTNELQESGNFEITPNMHVSIIDGQHRLAGLFLLEDDVLRDFQMPVVFMINVSIPLAAKLFQSINGKQKPVNKSVIFDLFDNVPVECLNDDDDRETKLYHTICVSLYTDHSSPFYRQIKMLGVGDGAISQAFFINACKQNLKSLSGTSIQDRFDVIYDFFALVQRTFPDDWPKPLGECSDAEIDEHSRYVLKTRKSQLAKTNGITAMLRLLDWMRAERRDTGQIQCLKGQVDWTKNGGTGAVAQKDLFDRLKALIIAAT